MGKYASDILKCKLVGITGKYEMPIFEYRILVGSVTFSKISEFSY